MLKYFGTDGIRGRFGDPSMCPEFAFRLGSVLGAYLKAIIPGRSHFVVIGRDTRASGEPLCNAIIAGLNRHDVYVHNAGIVPTPAVAQAILEIKADLGLVVTASHNPACDNGIKLFSAQGYKLNESEEALIEALIEEEPAAPLLLPAPKSTTFDAASFYVNYLRSLMDQHCLKNWRIVLDLANGATSQTSPAVFDRWGADLHLIGHQPDGTNINQGVGSEYPAELAREVLQHKGHLGIAHDGDGDRLVVCDEQGVIVDGDILLALFGRYAMRAAALKADTLVATVHSNLGLDRALERVGGRVDRVQVGDRNVAERMREIKASVGGESSGHIIFSDFSTTGDGLLAAVKLIGLMRKTGRPLSELRNEVKLFPQATTNLRVSKKLPLEQLDDLQAAIAEAEKDFGYEGRVLVRYSGTEPKLRLLVEGADKKRVNQVIKRLETVARRQLDVIDS
jgi:phosphoglucosamine mutase